MKDFPERNRKSSMIRDLNSEIGNQTIRLLWGIVDSFTYLLGGLAVLMNLAYLAIALIFLDNLASLFGAFLFYYTACAPFGIIAGYLAFHFQRCRSTRLLLLGEAFAGTATYFLWTSDFAEGIIH